jgi:hypothetical protein
LRRNNSQTGAEALNRPQPFAALCAIDEVLLEAHPLFG